ncbi:MAG: class I tRNA ligase family protein, partial [Cyanobacteria bacterium REEB65]|nr:class I tRNA ligase family protein [Cyanobacteria bacterium REEB65]
HATIMGRDGRRMSKSKGTGVDPLDIMAQYGTDACRFWMAAAGTSGQDVIFMPEKIEAARNFCNKLWNAARFALMNLPEGLPELGVGAERDENAPLEDRWIRSRLADAIAVVTDSLEAFTLARATDKLYEFVWTEWCDWWLEIAKPRLKAGEGQAQRTLAEVLLAIVKLMHPFTPFITEEVYAMMAERGLAPKAPSVSSTTWPAATARDEAAEADMNMIMSVVREVRRMRQELGVPAERVADRLVLQASGEDLETLQGATASLALLTRTAAVEATAARLEIPQAASAVVNQVVVLLPLAGLLDLDKERARLAKEIADCQSETGRLAAQLANEAFTSKAPAHVVDKLRQRRIELLKQCQILEDRRAKLE